MEFNMCKYFFGIFIGILLWQETALAQKGRWLDRILVKDSCGPDIRTIPAFSIYMDNYIITGFSVNGEKINKYTSDAKFQISLRHRLYKGHLPWNTYLFFTYTQKSFWDLYRSSAPFAETNYNPTVGIGRNFIRDNRIAGIGMLQFEHESNGRDSIWSRSWNMVSLMGIYAVNRHWTVQAKLWVPFMVADENRNLASYAGFGQAALTYKNTDNRFSASVLMIKRAGWIFNANWQIELAYKIFPKDEQYVFLQLYNGYGESMIDYNRFTRYLRVGIVVKPAHLTIF